MKTFVIRTFTAGVLVFIPLFFLTLVAARSFATIRKFAEPLVEKFSIEHWSGFLALNSVVCVVLAVIVFLLGLLAYLPKVSKKRDALDAALAERVPGYTVIKNAVRGKIDDGGSVNKLRTVLVRYNDTARVGFEVERTGSGEVIVFLPDSPNPQTGITSAFLSSEVEYVSIPPREVIDSLNFFGKGLGESFADARRHRSDKEPQ